MFPWIMICMGTTKTNTTAQHALLSDMISLYTWNKEIIRTKKSRDPRMEIILTLSFWNYILFYVEYNSRD